MSIAFLLLAVLISGQPISAETVVFSLSELEKPNMITIDHARIFIADNHRVHIFHKQDLKPLARFGKRGEGPREFKPGSGLELNTDGHEIMVESQDKLSFFDKSGKFLREIKFPPSLHDFSPTPSGYLAKRISIRDGTRYTALLLMDKKLKTYNTLYQIATGKQAGKRQFLAASYDYRFFQNRIYSSRSAALTLEIYDLTGKRIRRLHYPHTPKRLCKDFYQRFYRFLRQNRPPQFLRFFKTRVIFPTYFPAINGICIDQNTLYLLTHIHLKGKVQFIAINLKSFKKRSFFIQFFMQSPIHPLPYSIRDGYLYQLYDNPESETWELHRIPIPDSASL